MKLKAFPGKVDTGFPSGNAQLLRRQFPGKVDTGIPSGNAQRLVCFLAAMFVAAWTLVFAWYPNEAAAQSDSLGTLGKILEQLPTLSKSGAVDKFRGTVESKLNNAREEAVTSDGERAQQNAQARNAERALAEAEQKDQRLIEAYCRRSVNDEEEKKALAIFDFSRLEQDYCLRAAEGVRQFGYALFRNALAETELSVGAISSDYVLGIGDELIVTLRGQDNLTYRAEIDREGQLILPNWQPIYVAGRTFGDVRRQLEAETAATRLGTDIFVSLGAARLISVIVAGEVMNPGRYQLLSLSSLVDALVRAGGVKKTGSLRAIYVQRGDEIFWFDAYDLLLTGIAGHDLTLFDGDRIVVPTIGATAAVGGRVKRPGIFELPERKKAMTVADLIRLGGGTLRPRGNKFLHIMFDDSGREQLLEHTDPSRMVKNGEIILVMRRQDIQVGGVELLGHVRVPGRRVLAQANTMRALIGADGGQVTSFADNPYLLFAALETTDPTTRARRLFPVNVSSVVQGQQDYALQDDDRLIILSGDEVAYLSSAEVQQVLTQGFDAAILRQVLGRTEDAVETEENQQQQEPLLSGAAALQQSTRLLLEQQNQVRALQVPKEETPPVPSRACAGLLRLADIVATSSLGRFAGAVRNIESDDQQSVHVAIDCPEIYDDFPDLLPLALEHAVAMNGEVRRPGAYPVAGETAVASLVAMAGGLTREVDLTRVEISQIQSDVNNGVATIDRKLVNLSAVGIDQVALGAGSVVRFNPVFLDRDTGPVLLVGEFVRPGLYEIRRGERLSEIINRAGGLTAQAYPYGAVFTRERVKRAQEIGFKRASRELNASLAAAAVRRGVSANALLGLRELARELEAVEALGRVVIEADPTVLQVRPALDGVLEPGDRIYMPKRPNFVTVIGDVLNPGALQFISGTTADIYIRQAGGFQASADEDRVFVVYPNGVAEPLGVNAWNFQPVQIPPGSTIVVPKDPVPFDLITVLKDGASLVSSLAVTAASLAVIGNN